MRASTARRILSQVFSSATSNAVFKQVGSSPLEFCGSDELLESLIPPADSLLRTDQLDEVRALRGLDDSRAHAEVRFALSCAASAHITSGISAADIQQRDLQTVDRRVLSFS